jgi:hypothetical protein
VSSQASVVRMGADRTRCSGGSVAANIPKWTAELGNTFRTQAFCGVGVFECRRRHIRGLISLAPSSTIGYGRLTTRRFTMFLNTPRPGKNPTCFERHSDGTSYSPSVLRQTLHLASVGTSSRVSSTWRALVIDSCGRSVSPCSRSRISGT